MKKILLTIMLCCTLPFTGCWDREELNKLALVGAFGLDRYDKTQKLTLSSQLIKPMGIQGVEGSSQKSPVDIIVTGGDTLLEASRNITKEYGRRAYFTHSKVIVISEEIAKEGIQPFLDFFARSREIRSLSYIVIAKNTLASKIIGEKYGSESLHSNYLKDIIDNSKFNSEASVISLHDFFKAINADGINPVTGVMEIIKQPVFPAENKSEERPTGIIFSGTAVFEKDKLVGYLNEIETRGLNWVTGKMKSGAVKVPSPKEEEKLITVEIKRSNSTIKPEIEGNDISFTVNIKVDCDLASQDSTIDTSDPKIFEAVEEKMNNVIKKEIDITVKKAQEDLKCDIFGFGTALSKNYPQKWDKIKDDWKLIFPKVTYKIKVNSKINATGFTFKPPIKK